MSAALRLARCARAVPAAALRCASQVLRAAGRAAVIVSEAQIVLPRDEATSPPPYAATVGRPHSAHAAANLADADGGGLRAPLLDREEGEQCSICLDVAPGVALPCGHLYHESCLDQWLKKKPTCPNCGRSYGVRIGSMPDGEMRWYRSTSQLAGHTCGTIVLHFHFPPGTTSGRRHAGRAQHAYLPDSTEGHELLALFQLAFRRRLLFALNESLTTGAYRPNFSIHMKTATSGGAARHGYPDEGYYASALEELRAVGVEPEAAAAEALPLDMVPDRGISACRLALLLLRLALLGALVALAFSTSAGKSVLLPLTASVVVLSYPFSPWCLLFLVLLSMPNKGVPPPSAYVVYVALAYSTCARLATGTLRRPFHAVSKFTRRLLRQPTIRKFFVVLAIMFLMALCLSPPLCALVQPDEIFATRLLRMILALFVVTQVLLMILLRRPRASPAPAGAGLAEPLLSRTPAARDGVQAALAAAPRLAPRRPAALAPGPGQPEILDADWSLFARCASLRGRPDAARLHRMLELPEDAVQRRHANLAVRNMLQNELDMGEDYFVFYHSYSASCILYEFQTALAVSLLGYPPDGPPVLRLDRRPFLQVGSLEALLSVRTGRQNDHAVEFRRVAISALVSWFASGEYRNPMLMHHFLRGYFGGHDLGDMTSLLEELLRACGLEDQQLRSLVATVLELGERWGFEMSRYRNRAVGATCPGHVMQIFIHSSMADAVAYGSKPLGRLASQGVPISAWLSRQCPLEGQARILVHPDLFLGTGLFQSGLVQGDPDRAQSCIQSGLVEVFTHSGSSIYGPAERRELLRQLDALLAPVFNGPSPAAAVARAAARTGLGYGPGDGVASVPVGSVDDAV